MPKSDPNLCYDNCAIAAQRPDLSSAQGYGSACCGFHVAPTGSGERKTKNKVLVQVHLLACAEGLVS